MAMRDTAVATVHMLVRRPVHEVFEAFVDPAVTTRFWFTRSSGRLEPGARVRWDWEMYGASATVVVTEFVRDERLRIEWPDAHGVPCPVEWRFVSRPDGTFVTVSNGGFSGSDEEAVAQALDAKGGFTWVLAGLKAWLEHGVALNLIADHAPEAHVARRG